uniref:Cupin type-1 domain-containing protein n=1 Tax=Helicotheca tamesis TaxID=374047 RepID=A0A6U0FY36_9STRA|mmetsp:Transcript_1712/g.2486  ORF Transcript_1712/g.2486 Transcript_1712/m.2486 type:complete len:193 (+) Transcript_1712:226-804(+)
MKVSSKQRAWGVLEKVALQSSSATIDQESPEIYKLYMDDDGTYPNNQNYPLLLYRSAFHGTERDGIDTIVSSGEWTRPWVGEVFTFHHYHCTAWEILVCVAGEADVQIGGPKGPVVKFFSGDVALIPPGLAHTQIQDCNGFTLLGSYPKEGFSGTIDTLRGAPTEEQRANIKACVTPETDPVLGLNLADLWK